MTITRLQRKTARVCKALEQRFGTPQWPGPRDPLDSLIRTILSQNTNDKNRDLAYRRLRERFPTWREVMRARPESIARAIKIGGLSRQKSVRIKAILKWIYETYGELSLDFFHTMPTDEIIKTFTTLKGVGLKTIYVVLAFACGRDVFPVDTHIHRITRRLGLVPEKATADKAHHLMAPLVPAGKAYPFHINLLVFGRTICHARNPDCRQCFVSRECLYIRGGEPRPGSSE